MTSCTSGKEPKTIGRNDAIPPSLPSRMNLEAGGSFAELLLLSFGQKGYEANRDQAANRTRTKRTSNGFVPRTKTTTGLAFRTRGGLPRHDLTWKPNQSLIKPRPGGFFRRDAHATTSTCRRQTVSRKSGTAALHGVFQQIQIQGAQRNHSRSPASESWY